MRFLFLKSLIVTLLLYLLFSCSTKKEEKVKTKYSTFNFEIELKLPGSPEIIYDAITGDISGWWDHTFSENPAKFHIEPKPGGGFWECFDETGENGVLHATVIFAQRGKMLRMDGPLGLAGTAIKMVHTYSFEKIGSDSTILKLSVHASGEMDKDIPQIVEKVWCHFLIEQFKPYVEAGKHLNKN